MLLRRSDRGGALKMFAVGKPFGPARTKAEATDKPSGPRGVDKLATACFHLASENGIWNVHKGLTRPELFSAFQPVTDQG
ncbi:hypothetical protein MRX96_005212 [Rhipicephalus microplus]